MRMNHIPGACPVPPHLVHHVPGWRCVTQLPCSCERAQLFVCVPSTWFASCRGLIERYMGTAQKQSARSASQGMKHVQGVFARARARTHTHTHTHTCTHACTQLDDGYVPWLLRLHAQGLTMLAEMAACRRLNGQSLCCQTRSPAV